MFELNKQLQKAIDSLYQNLREQDYGEKYSWKKIAELAGMQYSPANKDDIYYIANRVCLMLMRNDQRYLETIHKFGKRIVNPNEHQLIAKKTATKSVKIYRKAGAVLSCTNMELLNDDQKKEVIEAANRYNTLEMFTNEMLKKKQIGISSKEDIKTASLFLDTIKMFASKKS